MNLWTSPIANFLTYLRAGGAPDSTCRTRREHLSLLATALGGDPWSVTGQQLIGYFASLTVAQETRRGRRTTYRAFYSWAANSGLVTGNPALAIPVIAATHPNPRPVPDRVYKLALLGATRRVRLMIRLAAELGMRRAEVAVVHSNDLIEDLDGWSLVVHGKGGKVRVLPMPDSLAAELCLMPPGFTFPGADEGHLSPRWVGRLVADALPEGWTMHKLRHRFATKAYRHRRDLFTVQELLGHASPATTRAYVEIDRARMRETVEAVA